VARADDAYRALVDRFWDAGRGLFRISTRSGRLARWGSWHYWWQAHALDCVVDAVARGQAGERDRAERLVRGILDRNGGTLDNDYHDDLAWLGLALGRAETVAGLPTDALVAGVWAGIQAGWDARRGGIVWRRGDTYTNAPTNGPAAILAARRYRSGGDPADLAWARRITGWLDRVLVDAGTGVVWDGIHPGPGAAPNRDRYSYNQGTVAMAYQEVAALTGEPGYRERALQVARAGLPAGGGVLPDEGGGDRALFKGIYGRYAVALAAPRLADPRPGAPGPGGPGLTGPSPGDSGLPESGPERPGMGGFGQGDPGLAAELAGVAAAAWAARGPGGLFGPSWSTPPGAEVELSAHLSGVLLLGALAGAGGIGPPAEG